MSIEFPRTSDEDNLDHDDGKLFVYCDGFVRSCQVMFDGGTAEKPVDSFPFIASLRPWIVLSPVDSHDWSGANPANCALEEVKVQIMPAPDFTDDPVIASVDGMLQMLECPCYASLWR